MPLALTLLLVSLGLGLTGAKVSPADAESWARLNYDFCLTRTFTRPEEEPGFRTSHDLVVSVRVVDHCRPERQVTFYETPQGIVGARVIAVIGVPLRDQLRRLRGQSPETDVVNLCNRVEVHSEDLGVSKTYREILGELRSLRISPVEEPVIHLHGVRYTIWIVSVGNESMFSFSAPGFPRLEDETLDPLDGWVQNALRAVALECDQASQ